MTRSATLRRACGVALILSLGLTAGCRTSSPRSDAGKSEAIACCKPAQDPVASAPTKHEPCACDKSKCDKSKCDKSKHEAVACAKPKQESSVTSEPVLTPPPASATESKQVVTLAPARNERYVEKFAPRPAVTLPERPLMAPATTVADQPLFERALSTPDKAVDSVRLPSIVGRASNPPPPNVARGARPDFGHTPDYCMLTGELCFNVLKNQWRLRFASIDEEDPYGGSVTLDAYREMDGFRSGDLVTVKGALVDPDSRRIAPHYRMREICPVSR